MIRFINKPYLSFLNSILYLAFLSTLSCKDKDGNGKFNEPEGPMVSHGYVIGVTPMASPAFQNRTYSTVKASWGGPGGDKIWTKMNLGAANEAVSSTDNGPEVAGWYFQFNRSQGFYHDGLIRIPEAGWLENIEEENEWLPENDPCSKTLGGTWRLPTSVEWKNFRSASRVTGGMGNGNYNDAFNSELRLHAGGYLLNLDGSIQNRSEKGSYWSYNQDDKHNGNYLAFGKFLSSIGSTGTKVSGFNIRCIQE